MTSFPIYRAPRAVVLTMLCVSFAFAAPTLTVVDNGLNGSSNREWLIQVAPDAALFTSGQGSLATELGFEVTAGSLVSATKNATLWPNDNPGNDPFTLAVGNGVVTNLTDDTVFAALGSNLFTSGSAVDVLTIETQGAGATTLTWGGHTLLAGTAFQYTGSRIAQAGVNYDAFMGSVSAGGGGLACDLDGDLGCDIVDLDLLYTAGSPADVSTWLTQASSASNPAKADPADTYVIGDVNLNGDVNSTDLGALLNNFNSAAGVGWGGGDLNDDGNVNSTDLGALLNNFNFTSAAASAVPEPTTAPLLMLAVTGLLLLNRRK